ncbi:MAG: exodeoxyribonuclease VII large subunit [Hyphomicrobiales bacterium]
MQTDWPFDSPPGPEGSAGANIAEYSVSELSAALKRTVEDTYGHVRVRGELGRVSRPGSGHVYLDLKDDKAVLAGVMWKGVAQRLKIQPEQGLEVVVTGKLTTYPGQSKYQIVIEAMEPAGLGALMALLEERKKKLAAEGLFDEDRKKALPYMPGVIGVVTSPTGAVIRDILHRLSDRFPTTVIVWPARVQGEKCAEEVAAGIRGFNALEADGEIARPDLLIVARGGGSLEDLWGFNEEIVARAAAQSQIPLISAVGHETDWTLIDYVADERAPTPTAAAERAVPVRAELVAAVGDLARRQSRGLWRRLEEAKTALRGAARGLPRLTDLLALPRQRFDMAAGRLGLALKASTQVAGANLARAGARLTPQPLRLQLERFRAEIGKLSGRAQGALARGVETKTVALATQVKLLSSLGYREVLSRGYALVLGADDAPVRAAADTDPGLAVTLAFHDGRVGARIEDGGDAPPKKKKPVPKTRKSPGDDQGNLF